MRLLQSIFVNVPLIGIIFYTQAGLAEELTDELLAVDYTECMTGCLEYDGKMQCEILCGCAMEHFQSKFDAASYAALQEEMASDAMSPESRAFLDETAAQCVAELDRLMEEMGLVLPPEEEGAAPQSPEN